MITSWSDLRSVSLIADASSSAAADWPQICAAIARLGQALPPSAVKQVYLLGSNVSWPIDAFLAAKPPRPVGGHSFIAPVIAQVQREQRYAELAIVIGSGTVFDLADWLPSPWIGQWLLAPVGRAALAPGGVHLPSRPAAQLLDTPPPWSQPPEAPPPPPLSHITAGDYDWKVDGCGYPLLYVPPLAAYWSLFPVTWAQFEQYIYSAHPGDDNWVAELQPEGSRLSFRHAPWPMYERLLTTRLRPEEAVAFAHWNGCTLPTVAQWRSAYRWLQAQPALLPTGHLLPRLSLGARHIWQGLFRQCQPESLAALALMSQGVYEWVREGESYRLLGKPRPAFHPAIGDPLQGEPVRPIAPVQRVGHYGVRVMRVEGQPT